MKTWLAVLSMTALLCGAVACNDRDNNKGSTSPSNDQQARSQMGTAGGGNDTYGSSGEATAEPNRNTGATDTGRTGTSGQSNPPSAAANAQQGTQQEQRTISGKLAVKDQTARTFQLDNNGATYVAPPRADLSQLDGQEVTVQIDANGHVEKIRPTSSASDLEG